MIQLSTRMATPIPATITTGTQREADVLAATAARSCGSESVVLAASRSENV